MEKKNDLEDYWNELNVFQQEATKNSDELLEQESEQEIKQQLREEGEDEAEWLKDVGFGHLTDTFREGREISENDVTASVGILSKHQIDAVNRRVRLLNQTLKNRYRQQRGRHRKPDIRDVFKDIEVIIVFICCTNNNYKNEIIFHLACLVY